MVQYRYCSNASILLCWDLILVVVEAGLALLSTGSQQHSRICLNPYCSGRGSRTLLLSRLLLRKMNSSLNPYCSGRWFRTVVTDDSVAPAETGLNPYCSGRGSRTFKSCIFTNGETRSLNSCYSGRRYRTLANIIFGPDTAQS